MKGYVLRRIVALAPVLAGVSVLAFGLGHIAPGDPARDVLARTTGRQPTHREVLAERKHLGLDRPLPIQYASWLGHAVRGDLGVSYTTGEPVGRAVADTLPLTLELAGAALLLSVAFGVPLGVLAAAQSGTWIDNGVRGVALAAASVPGFWLAYLLILGFSVHLHVLPAVGTGGIAHLVLPAVTLAVFDLALLARLARASVLEVLQEDYVRTAHSKGLSRSAVLFRHALRAALIPLVTWSALNFGYLLGYSVVVETVFAWPGLGYTTVLAIQARDYPFIEAFVLVMGIVFVALNLVVDLLYVRIDPRVQLAAA